MALVDYNLTPFAQQYTLLIFIPNLFQFIFCKLIMLQGKNVSINENLHQEFIHDILNLNVPALRVLMIRLWQSTWDHPSHVEFANLILPQLEKFIVVDNKPIIFPS